MSMGKWFTRTAIAVTMLLGLTSSVALAQDNAPTFETVAVVSVASGDTLVEQLKAFSEVVGQDLYAEAAKEVSKNEVADAIINQAIDASKPAGIVVKVSTDGFSKQAVAFIPVKDPDLFRKFAEEKLEINIKESDEAGLYVAEKDGNTLYVKTIEGWLLFSDDSTSFGAVGDNPVPCLNGLNEKYAVAVQFLPSNVPETIREMCLLGFNKVLQEGAKQCPEKSPEADAQKAKLISMIVARARIAFTDTESATFGVRFNKETGVQFEATSTAVDGSQMARYFAKLADTKNVMAAALPEDTAVAATICLPIDSQKTEMQKFILDAFRGLVMKKLEDGKAEKIAAKASEKTGREISSEDVTNFFGRLFDAIQGEIEHAKCEAGFAIVGNPNAPALFAAVACDGKRWEGIDNDLYGVLADAAKKSGKCPIDLSELLKKDVASVNGGTIHLLTGPTWTEIAEHSKKELNEDSTTKLVGLFGEKPEVAIVYAAQGAGFVFCKDAVNAAKTGFEKIMTTEGKPVILEAFVAIKPILRMIAVCDQEKAESLTKIADEIEGSPKVSLTTTAKDRSVTTIFQIDTGILQAAKTIDQLDD